jgi:hypothetical protein
MGFDHPDSVGHVVSSIGGRADRGSRNLHRLLTNPLPNSGVADILDEAKAAFAKRYWEIKPGGVISAPEYRAAPRTTLSSLTGHSIAVVTFVFVREGERSGGVSPRRGNDHSPSTTLGSIGQMGAKVDWLACDGGPALPCGTARRKRESTKPQRTKRGLALLGDYPALPAATISKV